MKYILLLYKGIAWLIINKTLILIKGLKGFDLNSIKKAAQGSFFY